MGVLNGNQHIPSSQCQHLLCLLRSSSSPLTVIGSKGSNLFFFSITVSLHIRLSLVSGRNLGEIDGCVKLRLVCVVKVVGETMLRLRSDKEEESEFLIGDKKPVMTRDHHEAGFQYKEFDEFVR